MPSLAVCCLAAILGQTPAPGLTVLGRVSDPTLHEASALEASLRFPGVYWTVPDSGNPPYLYALDRTAKVLATYRVTGAVNFDWECLALDEAGRLFICDVGNNEIEGKSRLPQRWVYVVREPDPREPPAEQGDPSAPRSLALERTIVIRYPQAPFDIEASFAWDDAVYFVSKTRRNGALYRLPLEASKSASSPGVESPVTLEKVVDLPRLDRATSASLSPDRRLLAISTYSEVCLYNLAQGPSFALEGDRPARRLAFRAAEVEACAWDGRNLLLLNELGVLYRLPTE